ncbi:hypothetical protein BST14_26840 [Mycobacterium arosiense ATCC BAA-1401 = DSM 45069]|uniref:Uncharacterized protein n=1 Tax=Mycobacterium arosiense ATCC BAA-1401 = DSM 45069 TaxID=1265311 RepID=A0A1W9Z642_MYCAI|nr:hypothetical protein BST14_26840 [Mycobacterium arosiense ATCC BAA-1401 = DSM 45069]
MRIRGAVDASYGAVTPRDDRRIGGCTTRELTAVGEGLRKAAAPAVPKWSWPMEIRVGDPNGPHADMVDEPASPGDHLGDA